MCAAGVTTPSLTSAGTSSDTMMMYAGVVGMPMPRMIPAAIVSSRASSSMFCDSPTTHFKRSKHQRLGQ